MRPALALALTLAFVAVAPAARGEALPGTASVVVLDSARSQGEFEVRVMWLIGVGGRFGRVQGTVDIDRSRSQATVVARIDADAVTMRNAEYERWVKSDEFFDVAHHPEIRFESSPFPLARLTDGGDLPGRLTVRGVTQPVTFAIAPTACARPAYDCPVEAEAAIHRSAFGMRSRRGALSDKVSLRLTIFAVPPDGSRGG